MGKKVTVIGDVDYVNGHLRYGHFEINMDEDVFKKLSKKELIEILKNKGEFVLDDYSLEDYGDIEDIRLG